VPNGPSGRLMIGPCRPDSLDPAAEELDGMDIVKNDL
jgi:hypothetical protein